MFIYFDSIQIQFPIEEKIKFLFLSSSDLLRITIQLYKSMSVQSYSIDLFANFIHSGHFIIHLYFTVKVNEHFHVMIICIILILIPRNVVSFFYEKRFRNKWAKKNSMIFCMHLSKVNENACISGTFAHIGCWVTRNSWFFLCQSFTLLQVWKYHFASNQLDKSLCKIKCRKRIRSFKFHRKMNTYLRYRQMIHMYASREIGQNQQLP